MIHSMKNFFLGILGGIGTLLTGGKYAGGIRKDRSLERKRRAEQLAKDFSEHGAHGCKICSTRIPGNKQYCTPCYHKYAKKS